MAFLWIDSLCIVQYSPEDWEKESALMKKVYAGSTINLAACSSANGQGGCRREFHNSGFTHASRYYDLDLTGIKVRMFETAPQDWDETYDATPMQKRGWVVQERELAPRTLHFCHDILLWECKTSKASSEIPWFEMKTEDTQPDLLFNSPAEAETCDESSDTPFYKALDISPTSKALGMRHYWFSIVESYSRKQLYKESDRLPALDGLAQASSHPLKGRYVAGMWSSEMPSALLWQIDFEARKHAECCDDAPSKGVPSWSWASVNYGVHYQSQRSWQAHQASGDQARVQRICDFGSFSIHETHVSQSNDYSTSPILRGFLSCSGKMYHLILGDIKEGYLDHNQFISLCLKDDRTIGVLYRDKPMDPLDDQCVLFVPIRSELGGFDGVEVPFNISRVLDETDYVRGAMCMGIGMIQCPGLPGKYRRVGLLRFVATLALEEKGAEEFDIV